MSRLDSPRAYRDFLYHNGFETIGEGKFSTVHCRPGSTRAVKVSSIMDGWVEYVTWAHRRGFAGRQAPLVYSLKVIPWTEQQFYVAVVERLATTIGYAKWCDATGCEEALSDHALVCDDIHLRESYAVPEDAPRGWHGFVTAFWDDLGETLHDMHEGNWMARSDGSLVLNDPIMDTSQRAAWKSRYSTAPRVREQEWKELRAA